jgi:hypothetical protein
MTYYAGGGNNDDKAIDWKSLKLTPKTTTHTTTGRNKWRLGELELGSTCAGAPGMRGVFLAEIRSDEIQPDAQRGWLTPRRNRVLANVTDMGVLLKVGSASGLMWVTSLSTGAPVSGARVVVYTPQGKQVWTDLTNGDGIAQIPAARCSIRPTAGPDPSAEDWDNYRAQRSSRPSRRAARPRVDGNWSNGIRLELPAQDRHAARSRSAASSRRPRAAPARRASAKGHRAR